MDGKQTNTAPRLVPLATPTSSALLRRSSGGFSACPFVMRSRIPHRRLGVHWRLVGLEDEVEWRLGGTPYSGETGGL
jgi:hypothetical protein